MTDSAYVRLSGRLLIATPQMGDPRFKAAVIYICSHDRTGAMGLIINKPKDDLFLSEMLGNIGIEGEVRVADSHVLSGGPVDIDRGFVLHSADYFKSETSVKLSDTLHLTSTKDILEALVEDCSPSLAMLAIGYSGWGAGQIEEEIKDNAWIVAETDDTLIFDTDHENKWRKALASLGIKPEMLAGKGGSA